MNQFGTLMRQMDWSDLNLFLSFVRSGSMRGAAALANTSHATVARRMGHLSDRAGAQLYFRSGGQLHLTDAGRALFETAQRVEEDISQLERHNFGRDRQLNGRLVITTVDALAVTPFLRLIGDFQQAYPDIEVKLVTTMSLMDLDRREADIALRFGQSPDDHLVGRRLMPTARAVYAAPDYAQNCLATQREQPGWISFSPPNARETWKASTPFPDLPTVLRCTDMRTQQAACRAGLGLVMLPCFLCDPDPDLVRVSAPHFHPRQDMWLLRHADARDNARVRAIVRFLTDVMPRLAPLFRGETASTWTQSSAAAR